MGQETSDIILHIGSRQGNQRVTGGRLPVICAYDSNLSRLEGYIFRGECRSSFTIIFSTGENPEINMA